MGLTLVGKDSLLSKQKLTSKHVNSIATFYRYHHFERIQARRIVSRIRIRLLSSTDRKALALLQRRLEVC